MDVKPFPTRANLHEYISEAKALFENGQAADSKQRFERVKAKQHSPVGREIFENTFSLADAEWVIAQEHGFATWTKFVHHIQELDRRDSSIFAFESAADALVAGDTSSLKQLLQLHPELVCQRSTREHEAPLMHYVAANGVENFRQRTPRNIIEITRVLLDAGAEVDATTQAYGGASTALGLAATSYHPAKVGVQLELLHELLRAGASVDGAEGGWNPLVAALHNGRGDAALFLANHGARIDLEGAAGTGKLDRITQYLGEDGSLQAGATRQQLAYGFIWACEYGHARVVQLLLDRRFEPDSEFLQGQTGLHWAAFGGHGEIVDLLLHAKVPVNLKDRLHHGTPLGWALYGWNSPPPESRCANYYDVVKRLVQGGAVLDWQWLKNPDRGSALASRIRDDAKMLAALGLDRTAEGPPSYCE